MTSVAMVPVTLNGRWPLIIPEHRAARREWHEVDGWEGPRLLAMSERIGPGSVVAYIGAEEGDMPALCASWGAQVAMWEPNPRVWANIRAIWQANSLPAPLDCWAGFAGHEDRGEPEPAEDDGWPGCAHGPVIGDHGFCNLHERPDLPSIRLDTWSARMGVAPTDISIDVEGSEWQVLRGAVGMMRRAHPRIWLSGHPEFMYEHWREYLFDLRRWLREDFGYREVFLDYSHEVHLLYEAAA